jgi:cytochrome c oxidase subunit 2
MSQFIILTLPEIVGIITLAGVLIIVSVVIFLIANSTQSEDDNLVKEKFYKIRTRYFWGLSVVLVVIFFVSLRFLPYSHSQRKVDEVVTVVGIQWDWRMVNGVSNKTPHEFLGKNEIYLPVNKKIKFIVTSDDVTHNFSIYNNRGVLLTQTQAMPQYRNELTYVFTQKGKYTVLCLEYCGLVHPFMTGTIYVR